MTGLIVGGLFAVAMTGAIAWIFFRQARKEEQEARRRGSKPPER